VIDVAFTRAELRPVDIAVVIDVLRATSTATRALAAGYERVICTDSIERALALRAPGRTLAGERGCVIPPGFDLGNSPLESARRYTDELVLATTNGAPAIVAASETAGTVLLACLLNMDAVLSALRAACAGTTRTVQVVCAGTDDTPALEDAYVAGRLCAGLKGSRSDAALIAQSVAASHSSPLAALSASANACVLVKVGCADDITYCARESVLDTLPRVDDAGGGVATMTDAAPHRRAPRHARRSSMVASALRLYS